MGWHIDASFGLAPKKDVGKAVKRLQGADLAARVPKTYLMRSSTAPEDDDKY
jgi:hypothetical protein